MHFYRTRGVQPDPDLYLANRRLSCVEAIRYLGLLFDNRLAWVPHFRSLKASCRTALSLLRVLSHTSWGADRDNLLLLHRTLIFPKLENCCEIYSSAMEAPLRVLATVHHAGVCLGTGAFRTSPIRSLLVDAGFWPLDFRHPSSLLRCWFRTHRLPDSVPCLSILRDSRSQAYNTILHILMPSLSLMMAPNPMQALDLVWFSHPSTGLSAFLLWYQSLLPSCLP
ncbi:hypothetical protein E2C01_056210 [Portunus trituberculatus]|uniref:Uncharacterized protein n=1 Tax=Portunus trituberculatus TaxID=210409 RepID=A0A5B7GYB6_PORTR|nr:hypothetical protein [Portunus trituberculatus]